MTDGYGVLSTILVAGRSHDRFSLCVLQHGLERGHWRERLGCDERGSRRLNRRCYGGFRSRDGVGGWGLERRFEWLERRFRADRRGGRHER
jgi:hypothetical protein